MGDIENGLRAKAMRLLASREHSQTELARKLSQFSEASSEQIQGVVAEFVAAGYLDDQRFTEMLLRSALARGYGPMKLALSAREKGISAVLLAEVLAAADVDWLEQAKLQRAKKFGDTIPRDFKERARQSRFLAGRGFYSELINAVFHEKC
ncbi:regulatory protein RecX [Thiolinea disciformis]|uniref:regulatory protein RecX n=1 Tax=Thiolinea disciformis TaxID=125614 RepID=UPI00035ECDEC|nr:regulatory protein RecX [Thiolinea disciformis]